MCVFMRAYHPQNKGALPGALSALPWETSRKEDRAILTCSSFILFRTKSAKINASDRLMYRYPYCIPVSVIDTLMKI